MYWGERDDLLGSAGMKERYWECAQTAGASYATAVPPCTLRAGRASHTFHIGARQRFMLQRLLAGCSHTHTYTHTYLHTHTSLHTHSGSDSIEKEATSLRALLPILSVSVSFSACLSVSLFVYLSVCFALSFSVCLPAYMPIRYICLSV